MPKFVDQPADLGALPTLNNEKTARLKLKIGANKWINEIRDQIEHVRVGGRRYFSDQALLSYLSRNTHKPVAADPTPRKRVPPKPLPPAKCLSARKAERRPAGAP